MELHEQGTGNTFLLCDLYNESFYSFSTNVRFLMILFVKEWGIDHSNTIKAIINGTCPYYFCAPGKSYNNVPPCTFLRFK